MLISSFKLENGSIITPLFISVWILAHSVQKFIALYSIPLEIASTILSSQVVDATSEVNENPLSIVAAETMKLLGNSSYGYQIIYRSRHTITKYLMEEKTHKAINETLFKRLNTVQKNLCEIELLKSTIEHREPIIVGFFHSAKLRVLELYYNF